MFDWPQQVSNGVKTKSMRDYFRTSTWQKPAVCTVCGRVRYDIAVTSYSLRKDDELPPGFRSLLNIP